MRTRNTITLKRKILYVIMLLGIFLSTFAVGFVSSAHAQEEEDNSMTHTSGALPNPIIVSADSLSIPYLSEYTGAPTQNVDCGPAAVAMIVMAYGKRPANLSDIAFIGDIRVKMGNTQGATNNAQRITALAGYGISSTAITSSPLQTIKNAIAQGRPAIARVWGKSLGRTYEGHVVVVLGFSADFQTVFVNDPDNQSRYLNTSTPGGANRAWPTSTFETAMKDAYDSGNYFGLVISNGLLNYSAAWVAQSSYPTIAQGQSADISVAFKNTGRLSWSNVGGNPAHLGTTNPINNAIDYTSPFTCPTWIGNGRPAGLAESTVAPGNTGTFNFKVCVPSNMAPGTYRFSVAPLIEGIEWMFQPGVMVYWDITVTASARPSANFDAWGLSGTSPFTTALHIVNMSNITSCSWNYGDGQTSTICTQSHNHVYTSPGSYTVSLTVSGPGGSDSLTRPNYIVVTSGAVSDLIIQSITALPMAPSVNQPVTFTIRVQNQGTKDASPDFYVDFYIDSIPVTNCSDTGISFWSVSSLAPGEIRDFVYTHDGFDVSGIHNLYAFADTNCNVTEGNENNNILGPIVLDVSSGGASTFGDVPLDHPLYKYIQALYDGGYTGGCSSDPLMFCPDTILDRAQSAVFMLRGSFGKDYLPPLAPWNTFLFDNWTGLEYAQGWAEGMWQAGLTKGCQSSPLMYCPSTQLPRVEASVFGLRMKYGVDYTPPSPTGTLFADMTDPTYWGAGWAEQAYLDGLLPACGTDNVTGKPMFCPSELVDRGWGAYLIVKAKNLPTP